MNRRATVALLAWSLWALCVALFALTVVFLLLSPTITSKDDFEAPEALTVLLRAMALTYSTVGAFIAWRRPGNPIGWRLCGTGLLTGVRAFAVAYAQYGVAGRPGSLPGVEYMVWIASWIGAPGVLLAAALLLVVVFPDGRLLDRAWWAVVWMAVGGAALFALLLALDPTGWPSSASLGSVFTENPFAVSKSVHDDVVASLGSLGFVLLLASLPLEGRAPEQVGYPSHHASCRSSEDGVKACSP